MYGLIFELGERKFSVISDKGRLYYALLKDCAPDLSQRITTYRGQPQVQLILTDFCVEFETAGPNYTYDRIEDGHTWTVGKALKLALVNSPQTTTQIISELKATVGSNPFLFGRTFQFQSTAVAPKSRPSVPENKEHRERQSGASLSYGLIADAGDKRLLIIAQNGDHYYAPTSDPMDANLRSKIEELNRKRSGSRSANSKLTSLVVPEFAIAFRGSGDRRHIFEVELRDGKTEYRKYRRAVDLRLIENRELTQKVVAEVKRFFWERRAEIAQAIEPRKEDKPIALPPPQSSPPPPKPQAEEKPTAIPNSLGFATRRIPRQAQYWAPLVKNETWVRLHLALLSSRLIRIGHPIWARAYQVALGPSCHLDILPIEPHWLCFDDIWSQGLKAAWRRASERNHTLHLFVLQDCEVAACNTWSRPLINLHCELSNYLLPHLERGWPENLRILWTSADSSYCLDAYSVSVTEHGMHLGLNLTTEWIDTEVTYAEWELWGKRRETACPVLIPAETKLSPLVTRREMDRYFGAALNCGFSRERAAEVTREAFTAILDPANSNDECRTSAPQGSDI